MSSDHCSCKSTAETCRTTAGERPRYFPRQLVTAEDMMMEQEYFRNRMRLHNRLLHGWGVVCGLQVAPVASKDGAGGIETWTVKICRGEALGPYGDEIIVPCEVEIDLRQDSISGSSVDDCSTMGDVWCSDAWVKRSADQPLYLALRYAEIPARPVRVQPAGCGCDDNACEYSRLRDGYVIKVLTAEEYRPLAPDLAKLPDWQQLFPRLSSFPPMQQASNPACSPCPEQSWVVLACLRIDSEGRIMMIDNCGPRRLVAALGCFYWSCAAVMIASISDGTSVPSIFECGSQNPIMLPRGTTPNLIIVNGEGFQKGLIVDFGPGIHATVDQETISSTRFEVAATVADDAKEGLRNVVVINPDCSTAFCLEALMVPATSRVRIDQRLRPSQPLAGAEEVEAESKPKAKGRREGKERK